MMLINSFLASPSTQPYDLYFSFNGNLTNTGTLSGVTATPATTATYTASGVELSAGQRIVVDATALELSTSNWEFSTTLNISTLSAAQNVFSKNDIGRGDGFEIGINTDGSIYFYKYGAGGTVFIQTSGGVIATNTSYVVDVYYDGTNVKIDIDGVNQLTSNQTGLNIVSTGNPYRVGGISSGVNDFTGTQENLYFNVY